MAAKVVASGWITAPAITLMFTPTMSPNWLVFTNSSLITSPATTAMFVTAAAPPLPAPSRNGFARLKASPLATWPCVSSVLFL